MSSNPHYMPVACCFGSEDLSIVTSDDVQHCLQHGSPINVTASRVMVSYTYPGHPPLVSNSSHGHVCWVQVNSSSPDTELEVEWLTQTCNLVNYVTVHDFCYRYLSISMLKSWRSMKWTGCETREDPMSAKFTTTVSTIYVGLHVQHTDTPYTVSLTVRAVPRLIIMIPKSGQEHLEIVLVSPYSG